MGVTIDEGESVIVKILLDHAKKVRKLVFVLKQQDAKGNTPLILAARKNFFDIVKMLTEKSVGLNHQNNDGYSALHFASGKGYDEVVAHLLKKRANPFLRGKKIGAMPLHLACIAGHENVVKALFKNYKGSKKAFFNKKYLKTNEGFTAFDYAFKRGYEGIANYLLHRSPGK